MELKSNEWRYNGNTIEMISSDFTGLIPITQNTAKSRISERQEAILKRIVDVLGSLIGLIFVFPLTIVVGIANFIFGDRGPIFFTQKRIGKNGKIFKMYKFRTMVTDADEKLQYYLENNKELRQEYELYKKLKYDPRVTKIGNLLRKTSLDEFPQFINVLKGEMSLVGPRPYLPREKEDMGWYYEYIIRNKPGLTGLWQTNGRSNVTFNERLNLDLEYLRKESFSLYIKLIFKTIVKFIKKEGAV